jgi:hypothetical protein
MKLTERVEQLRPGIEKKKRATIYADGIAKPVIRSMFTCSRGQLAEMLEEAYLAGAERELNTAILARDVLKSEVDKLKAALTELVELKELKNRGLEMSSDYRERRPKAWAAARKAIGR